MEDPQRSTDYGQKISFKSEQVHFSDDGNFHLPYAIFGQGGHGRNRWTILCLALLNLVLLTVAVVLGYYCANFKQGSSQVSHSAAAQLIDELNYLQSNHSDVIAAKEDANVALQRALKNHEQLKEEIQKQKNISDGYQRQMEALLVEKANVQSNVSALEGTCGRCLVGWTLLNTTCYFFSYFESSTVKKNWPESRADCVSRGADLVVIDNQEEQEFISNIAKAAKRDSAWKDGFWVGLTDLETEGTWVWINNVTEVEQRYWYDGEPNNHGRDGENCVITVDSQYNPWQTRFDGNCQGHQLYWICEMSSN